MMTKTKFGHELKDSKNTLNLWSNVRIPLTKDLDMRRAPHLDFSIRSQIFTSTCWTHSSLQDSLQKMKNVVQSKRHKLVFPLWHAKHNWGGHEAKAGTRAAHSQPAAAWQSLQLRNTHTRLHTHITHASLETQIHISHTNTDVSFSLPIFSLSCPFAFRICVGWCTKRYFVVSLTQIQTLIMRVWKGG